MPGAELRAKSTPRAPLGLSTPDRKPRCPHIVLLTPGHLSTNPRIVKEADALADAGYRVSVIAADFLPWAREADLSFAARPWMPQENLSFGPHAPPGRRAVQVIRQRLARAMVGRGIEHDRVVRAACHPIAPELAAAALRRPADLYIAHYTAALPAAALAARRFGARYAFDAEDFHPGEAENRSPIDNRLLSLIERRYLPDCTYITSASPGIAEAYAALYRVSRPETVLNVFPLVEAPPGPTAAGAAEPGPSLYWFSQTIGPDRGLECAIRAIGRTRSRPHLYLRGVPARAFAERLRKIAAESGVAEHVHYLPPAPPAEMARLAASYDVGLAGETGHTANRQIALTNKLFTYLLAGVPTLLSDIPAHRRLAQELGPAGRLFPTEDEAALAVEIDGLLCDAQALARARSAAYDLGQARFNWDREKRTLLRLVGAALSG